MNLLIEQGNSATKLAVCEGDHPMLVEAHKRFSPLELEPLFARYGLTRGILSSVVGINEEMADWLRQRLPFFLILEADTPLPPPLRIGYRTPVTLGKDRLAAVAGAIAQQPGRDILVIDAGTAITYDLVEASGFYRGGNISPGMSTRFRALHQFTSALPLVEAAPAPPLLGDSTLSAIQAGVAQGIRYEMDGYIRELRESYPDLFIFLTGGHSFYFENKLKNATFADANLVLKGLNRILEYNVEIN
ncbi:MAG: type III pantothenate kinase [Tannerella sp.]|jgi:type III pantothenate kinase|nr:type III pantothenate kinase [Tannerella sp.]